MYARFAVPFAALTFIAAEAHADPFEQSIECHAHLEQGLYESAIEVCSSAIATGLLSEANASITYNNRGRAWLRMNQNANAAADFARALTLDERNVQALNNQALIYFENDDLDDAADKLNAALDIRPEYTTALYNRGRVLSEMGRKAAALEDFASAIRLEPSFAAAILERDKLIETLTGAPVLHAEATDAAQRLANAMQNTDETPTSNDNEAVVALRDVAPSQPPAARDATSNTSVLVEIVSETDVDAAEAATDVAAAPPVVQPEAPTQPIVVEELAVTERAPTVDRAVNEAVVELALAPAAPTEAPAADGDDPKVVTTSPGEEEHVRFMMARVATSPELAAAVEAAPNPEEEAERREERLGLFLETVVAGAVDVARLQRGLIELGFNPGPVDGIYGPRTRGAIVACFENNCDIMSAVN